MGAEPSKRNLRNAYPDYNRAHTPGPREPEVVTEHRGYSYGRMNPSKTYPASNVFPITSAELKPTNVRPKYFSSGVTAPTNHPVNSLTSGFPTTSASVGVCRPTSTASVGVLRPATTASVGISRPATATSVGVSITTTASTGGVSRPIGATSASAEVFRPIPAVSTTGYVAKPTIQHPYHTFTSGVSKPSTSTPGISKVPGRNIPTPVIHPATGQLVDINEPTTISPATSVVFKPSTAATNTSTGEVPRSTDLSLFAKEVNSTQPLYPYLPKDSYLEEEEKIAFLRIQQANLRDQNEQQHEKHKRVLKLSQSGRGKNHTPSKSFEPSSPEYSVWDTIGASRQVLNGFVESSGSTDHKSEVMAGDLNFKVCESVFGFPGRKRDSSPVGSESSYASRNSSVGRNLGRPNKNRSRARKPKTNKANDQDNNDDPPTYGDVVAEINAELRGGYPKNFPKKNTFQRQYTPSNQKNNQRRGRLNTMDDRFRPKNVDELNDLIKKEFGSLGEPTNNLPFVLDREKLFSGRNRLFVGNLPYDVSREDVNQLMGPYGEIVVEHHNAEKKFGFVTLKHRDQAESAQRNLDGYVFRGRSLRVRLANRNSCFNVLNLDVWVTNELLKKAFTAFGEVERAEIIVKDGKPTGEGFLEYSDKRAGRMALEACVENCFLLTSSLRPVILREINPDNCSRGFSERQINKNNAEYRKSREAGPCFVAEGSKENECAKLWKSFYERRKREEEEFAKRMQQEEKLLEEEIRSKIKFS